MGESVDASASNIGDPGPWIGHYTSAATAFEHILPTGRLRMSPYALMVIPLRIRT
jgi:hypothetical protein